MAEPINPNEAILLMCYWARLLARLETWQVNELAVGTAQDLKECLDNINHYASIVKTGLPDG